MPSSLKNQFTTLQSNSQTKMWAIITCTTKPMWSSKLSAHSKHTHFWIRPVLTLRELWLRRTPEIHYKTLRDTVPDPAARVNRPLETSSKTGMKVSYQTRMSSLEGVFLIRSTKIPRELTKRRRLKYYLVITILLRKLKFYQVIATTRHKWILVHR